MHPQYDQIKVRRRYVSADPDNLPASACVLLNWAAVTLQSQQRLTFVVEGLPPSVNKIYRGMGRNRTRTDEYRSFESEVAASLYGRLKNWNPLGTVMVLVILESPNWVTKKNTIRDMDADNRLKALLDCIQHATSIPDNINWEVHVWKQSSDNERSSCFLFDLGDVVNHFTNTNMGESDGSIKRPRRTKKSTS